MTAGRDMMACAQTGSGKTAAFLIPSCSALFSQARTLVARAKPSDHRFVAKPLVLILAPTRELCCQIFDEARRVKYLRYIPHISLETHSFLFIVLLS